ncbi:MAG: hypothetical protein CL920_20975 [Deltaproteobacteria bacterium]|nr:hypothetical protein [Deltaproteobacteria bacterium]|tara:strand:- start:3585 stop:4646 length:1062 start_codon:yes stop_codon:yes gene_type:complete
MNQELLEAVTRHIKDLIDHSTEQESLEAYLDAHPEMREDKTLLMALALAERIGISQELQLAMDLSERLCALTALLESDHEATAQLSHSRLLRIQNRLDEAELALHQATKVIEERELHDMLGRLYGDKALLFLRLGHYDRAEENFLEAIKASEAHGGVSLGQVYLEYGNLLTMMARHEEAEKSLQQALELFADEEAPIATANTHVELGKLLQMQGKLSEAEDAYQKALPMYQTAQDARGLGNACRLLGILYDENDDAGAAETAWHNALQLFQQTHYQPGIFEVSWLLGEHCVEAGKLEEAEDHLRQSLALAGKLGQPDTIIEQITQDLAMLFRQLGRDEEADELLSSLRSASTT